MSSLIFLLFLVGTISAAFKGEREFEVKQGSLLNLGRTYTITETGKLNAGENAGRFTIENDMLSPRRKLILLENGKPLYEFKHKMGHLYQKWHVYDSRTGETIGTFRHRPSLIHDSYKLTSTKLGMYRITGKFGNRTFKVKRDGQKVAEIHKDRLHVHDTYSVKIQASQDPAVILLITIGIDEIRQH
ncbi:unnamed protein product [Adineta steineri]|uniref:Uncharacterized protein n=1 Tax=Adineta steineri TaxID=433720 RepID=A0A819VK06_9BILA|nr:unnamed protein product [Adineta steineri]CAF4110364.1 unnamed protein product [Adineta steineri]